MGFDLSVTVDPLLHITEYRKNKLSKEKYCFTRKRVFKTADEYSDHIQNDH